MLGAIDHVGYLVDDLERGIETFAGRLGAPLVRRFERPQFGGLVGAYLGSGPFGDVEVFTFTDPATRARRVGAASIVLDHVAHEVQDIHAVQARLGAGGVRFCGPDLGEPLDEPVDLGGVLHLWTEPATCSGLALQLMQRG